MSQGTRPLDKNPSPYQDGKAPDTSQAPLTPASPTNGPIVVLHCPSNSERHGRPSECTRQCPDSVARLTHGVPWFCVPPSRRVCHLTSDSTRNSSRCLPHGTGHHPEPTRGTAMYGRS